MRITEVELRPYKLAFQRPYKTASVVRHHRSGFIVRVVGEDGLVGLGEAAPLGTRTEGHASCLETLLDAAHHVEGADLDTLLEDLDKRVPVLANANASRFGLSGALFDLAARRDRMSLARWLADRFTGVKAITTDVPVNATIPSASIEDTVAHALERHQAGFTTFKLKVGHDTSTDPARIAAVREALGPDVTLRLDANQGWARHEAADLVDRFAELDIDYIEQPVHIDDPAGLAWLRQRGPLRVAADEPVRDMASVQRLLELGAADVYVLKPMVLGGADRALRIAQAIEAEGLDTVITSTIDGVIARAGALATAAALGQRELACGLATASLLDGDVAPVQERIEDGRMFVNDAVGHGLSLA